MSTGDMPYCMADPNPEDHLTRNFCPEKPVFCERHARESRMASRDLLPALRAVRDAWRHSLESQIDRHKARIIHALKVESGQEIVAEGAVEALEEAMEYVPSDLALEAIAARAEGETARLREGEQEARSTTEVAPPSVAHPSPSPALILAYGRAVQEECSRRTFMVIGMGESTLLALWEQVRDRAEEGAK